LPNEHSGRPSYNSEEASWFMMQNVSSNVRESIGITGICIIRDMSMDFERNIVSDSYVFENEVTFLDCIENGKNVCVLIDEISEVDFIKNASSYCGVDYTEEEIEAVLEAKQRYLEANTLAKQVKGFCIK
jgi:hypothetical protein